MKSFSEFIAQTATPINGFCILKPEFLNWEDDFHSLLTNNKQHTKNRKNRK